MGAERKGDKIQHKNSKEMQCLVGLR